MDYEWVSGLLILLCIAFLVIGIVTLARGRWFVAWLRGMSGIACMGVAIVFALLAVNLFSYRNLTAETAVATISFAQKSAQEYQVNVAFPGGSKGSFRLTGDLWQIDAKIIKWYGLLAALGFEPGYKLDRLQGRYIALEEEQSLERTVYALSEPDLGFDLWETIQTSHWVPWVDAIYGSATYLPMADGAIFSVSLSQSGLVARPMNEPAELAVNEWN